MVAAGLLVPVTAGAGEETTAAITVMATSDCPGTFECLEVGRVDGRPGPNGTIEVRFENEGQDQHDLHVTTRSKADTGDHSTPKTVAMGSTGTVDGPEGRASFTVRVGAADGVYFWCDRSGHEEAGMWIEQPFAAFPAGMADDEPSAPSALWATVVGLLAAAVMVERGRR